MQWCVSEKSPVYNIYTWCLGLIIDKVVHTLNGLTVAPSGFTLEDNGIVHGLNHRALYDKRLLLSQRNVHSICESIERGQSQPNEIVSSQSGKNDWKCGSCGSKLHCN